MNYAITEQDKQAILQPTVQYQYRMTIEDDKGNILDQYNNITPSIYSISSDSQIRRSIDIIVEKLNDVENWINLYMRLNFVFEIGVYSYIQMDFIWYKCGTYVITDSSTVCDSTNNNLSTVLMDWFAKMDGTRNGQVGGAPTIVIEQKDSNGDITTLQKALRNFISAEEITDKIIIDDIGEFYGQQSTNPNGYEEYRKNNPYWNKLPYDLEFSPGDTQADIVNEIVTLYPNIQAYFDIFNNFCCNMIPSCENDSIVLDNDFIQEILLAENTENTSYTVTSIKNITEVFGKDYDIDRDADINCTVSNNIFSLTLDEYTEYVEYEIIAFKPTSTNSTNPYLKINSLDNIPIYREYSSEFISENTIKTNEVNTIMIRKQDNSWVAYYLGQYQPHAICVLVDGLNDTKYTKSYFENKYNCKNLTLRVEPDSPYTVQKLGEILDVKTGDEFDNIISESVALENAVYFNKQSSSMNDTIELTTKMLPWLDINLKVEYKKINENVSQQYIIKNISNNLSSCTSTISLQRFYPLYFD